MTHKDFRIIWGIARTIWRETDYCCHTVAMSAAASAARQGRVWPYIGMKLIPGVAYALRWRNHKG